MERAVDLADVGVHDIYKVSSLTSTNWMSEVCTEVTNETTSNCLRTAGLMAKGPLLQEYPKQDVFNITEQIEKDLHS